MLTTIRQGLYLLGREQRKRWVALLFLAILTSLLEVIAAALVYVLLALVSNPGERIELPLIGDLETMVGDLSERRTLLLLISSMIAFFLVRGAGSMGAEYVMTRMTHNAAARLSARLIRGYLRLPYAFHLQHNSSELIRNVHQVPLDVVGGVFNPLIRLMAECILALGILTLLVLVSPLGTGLAIVVVGTATVVLMLVVQPRMKRAGKGAHEMNRETLGALQQSFHGVRDIKLFGREAFFSQQYSRARRRLARMLYVSQTLSQTPRVVIETSLILFMLVLFAVTVARGGTQGALATLGLFAYAGLRLQPSLQRIAAAFNSLKFTTAPVADIHRDLRIMEQEGREDALVPTLPFENEIVLDGVSFAYDGAESPALRDACLAIKRGEHVGICGPTGGGKSTLVDLVAGLLAPCSGRVLVDGQDIARNVRGWQANIGMVPQTVFLLDDTLRRNIALGIPDADIREEAVAEAVALAQLDDFVSSLPKGLDTIVGERGVRLSGGERQRIAIARALYRRPQLLIFDEGTSALDNTTEQELMHALKGLRGTHTMLLVAHRLSTVRDADRVIFVAEGRIAGIDTFDNLCERNDSFRLMARAT